MDRIIYDTDPEWWNRSVRPDRLEVLDVPRDDNGLRPAMKVYGQSGGRPDLCYWVVVDDQDLGRCYIGRANGAANDVVTPPSA